MSARTINVCQTVLETHTERFEGGGRSWEAVTYSFHICSTNQASWRREFHNILCLIYSGLCIEIENGRISIIVCSVEKKIIIAERVNI